MNGRTSMKSAVLLAITFALPPAALAATGDTPCDGDLRAWRVSASNCVAAVAHDAGVPFSLRVAFTNGTAGAAAGRLSFTSRRRKPQAILDSWIPPYVGIRAREVSLRIQSVGGVGCAVSAVAEYLPPGSVPASEVSMPCDALRLRKRGWTTFRHALGDHHGERLADISLEVTGGAGASCELLVADVRLILDDGTAYDVLSPGPPLLTTGMDAPAAAAPLPLPTRPRIQFGVAPEWPARYWRDLDAFGAFMAKYLPEFDIVLSMNCGLDPNLAHVMRRAPPNIFFQEQDGLSAVAYPRLAGALVRNQSGRPRERLGGVVTGTHAMENLALEDRIAMAASIGYPSFQMFDYVWYWPNSPWGFDDATADAFRGYLDGADGGLRLCATDGLPERTIRFRDYYEDYFGKGSMPGPGAFGLDSWEKWTPRFSTAAEKRLHMTLCHYQWLQNAQNLNDWTVRHCGGPGCDYLLNGEGFWNANDHVYLMRLANSGVVSPEFFHGAIARMALTYRNDRLVREARRCGRTAGICVECSSGGGASQPYWSEKTGYALCYLLSALGYDSFEYDHVPEIVWRDPPELHDWNSHTNQANIGKWRNLTLAMSDARGYRQAKLDGARRPGRTTFLLRNRMVNRHADDAAAKIADSLIARGIDFALTDPQELPDILDAAKTLFVSPSMDERPDVLETLARWRDANPDRTLLRTREEIMNPPEWLPRVQEPVVSGGAWAMPFECGAFRSAVLVNADAAATFGSDRAYDAWLAEFRKCGLGKRETYDHSMLMFPDECPGPGVSAAVPAEDGRYRVYSTMDGSERVADVTEGHLALELGNRLCDVVYYGKDGPQFAAFLSRVKAERAASAEFLFQDDSLVKGVQ